MKEIAHREQYERFKWKRICAGNITKVLNEGEWASRTYIGFKRRKMHVAITTNVNIHYTYKIVPVFNI